MAKTNNMVPEGWTLREAESLYDRLRTPRVYDRNQVSQSGKYPVIDQSESGCIGYLDVMPDFDCSQDMPLTTFANHTCAVRQMSRPFGVIQNVFPLKAKSDVSQHFLYQIINKAIPQTGYKGHYPELRETQFLTPPLPEQQKIATILSSVDDVIEKTRAQIDKLKDLKTGMMQELLTKGIGHTEFKSSDVGQIPKSWACDLVSSLFEIQLGKMLSQAAKVGASPMPYLGNKDVQWGKINVTDLQTMDFSEREREKFLLKPGDLLMCEGGEVGRSAIWEGELKECYYQKAIHRLRPIDDAYEPRLLLEYMRYAKGQNLLADFISQTSIAHLTREKLSAIPIPVPPVAEQKKIVDIITSIDTRINRHLDKLKNTYDIKKALMQDLLTGKVRVKPNESAAIENA